MLERWSVGALEVVGVSSVGVLECWKLSGCRSVWSVGVLERWTVGALPQTTTLASYFFFLIKII